MDLPTAPAVSRMFGSRVEYRWIFEGRAWRELRCQDGRAKEDAGLVGLERVLARLGSHSFERDKALRIDEAGANRLGLQPSH